MDQDPSLNNLIHPENYKTLPTDQFGKVIKKGHGKKDVILIAGLRLSAEDSFGKFMNDNEDKYTMYAITLAGYGATPAYPMPKEGTSYADMPWHMIGKGVLKEFIKKHKLSKPIIITHYTEGTIIARKLAIESPEMIGGIISLGSEAFRPMGEGGKQISSEIRKNYIDKGITKKWFKTVTRETWNKGSLKASALSIQNELAATLKQRVNGLPLPVMIRYMCESWAEDPRLEYQNLKVPLLAVIPGFTEDFLNDKSKSFYKMIFIDSWAMVNSNDLIKKETIPNAGIFVHLDQPKIVNKMVWNFIHNNKN